MESKDGGFAEMDDGVVRSSGLNFLVAQDLFCGKFGSVDYCPNSTHRFLLYSNSMIRGFNGVSL